jgi:hypothetical protein
MEGKLEQGEESTKVTKNKRQMRKPETSDNVSLQIISSRKRPSEGG